MRGSYKIINKTISINDFKAVKSWFKYFGFALDTPSKVSSITAMISQDGLSITTEQAISLLRIVSINNILKNIHKLKSIGRDAIKLYDNGESISCISNKYGLPPLTILREIMVNESRGYSYKTVNDLFNGKSRENPLKGRDLHEYYVAEFNDASSPFVQRLNGEKSKKNEDIFVSYFANIKHKTEDDLRKEQMDKDGVVSSTPDILFLEEVIINGSRVVWLDYKDYIGTTLSPTWESCQKQAKKYNELWGPGAICYRHSFLEGMEIDGTLLLDVAGFPNPPVFEPLI